MKFDTFEKQGFELIKDFIGAETAKSILTEVETELAQSKGGGIRHADKKFSSVENLVSSEYLLSTASRFLSGEAQLVRVILFDKSPDNNWLVTWHQDKTVVMPNKFEREGWGPWSIKDGVHHVQPPLEVLNNMVAIRIHLDDSNLGNGCLKVMPGSHRHGLLSQKEIQTYFQCNQSATIEAPVNSALVLRPHILHSSSKGTSPSRRRVLHIEYGVSFG